MNIIGFSNYYALFGLVMLPIIWMLIKSFPPIPKNYSFSKWSKSVKVNLIKGSSVLDIAYSSKDKASIMPILEDISKAYEKYSYRDSSLEIERGIDYLTKQVAQYKLKSANSFRESYEFALKNELIPLGLTNNNEKNFNIKNESENFEQTNYERSIKRNFAISVKNRLIPYLINFNDS